MNPSRKVPNLYERDYNHLNMKSRTRDAMRGMTASTYDKCAALQEAVGSGDFNKVVEIVKDGFPIQVGKDGKSPIHIAAENGYYEILQFLLQAFPMYNVNSPDQTGNTPLHRAANIGHLEMIKTLLERGAQVNVQDAIHGHTPLHEAAWKGFADSVDLLCLVGRLPNLVDYGLSTPLHLAVQSGHNQTTRNLIKCGADIAAKNKFGDTPLHTAVRYGHAGVSRILICISANVNNQNQNGDTPLHIAAALKRRKIVKFLIDAGALIDIRNYQSESPIDVAVKKSHKEILEILSEARGTCINPKTVSFNPNSARAAVPVQSRHISIPNEVNPSPVPTSLKIPRTQSESPNDKTKPKKNNIVKGIFSRKKKDKTDKGDSAKATLVSPVIPNKSILTSSKRKKSDPLPQAIAEKPASTPRATPVPGLMNTYQPQKGNLFFKDLAGNIKQGPIGFTPVTCIPSTCNCTQYTHSNSRNPRNYIQQPNVCMDHGYTDYHGPMTQFQEGKTQSKVKEKGKEKIEQVGYPLVKAKSDESLNQSEHKVRMQEERLKDAKASKMRSSPVKGRRQSLMNNNWNYRQNSLIKDVPKDSNIPRISIQISQKARELKEDSLGQPLPLEAMRAVMRPSPDGQTDSLASPTYEHPKYKVDWRAGKYRSDKVMLPSSKV